MRKRMTFGMLAGAGALAALSAGGAIAGSGGNGAGDNGAGDDADGDSNPAVNTRLIARIGDAAEAALDPPFRIITFETEADDNADLIHAQKADSLTVTFTPAVKRQICEGQQYDHYRSECTYMAAPSGRYAAVYRDEFRRPLSLEFERPVCAAAMAIYPTGGDEGETFKIVLQPYAADGGELDKAEYEFNWTKDTFRWRLMAGAFFLDRKAKRLEVNVESLKQRSKAVRFLIDDVAFVENACDLAFGGVSADDGAESEPAPASEAGETETAGKDAGEGSADAEDILPVPEEIEGS